MLTTNELQKYIMSEINDKLEHTFLVQIQIIIFFMQKRGR